MAPGVPDVIARIRRALRKAQRKILHSRQRLESTTAAVRAQLLSRR